MRYSLRLGEKYKLSETDEDILITAMHGFDTDKAHYFFVRRNGKPHCFEFRDYGFNFLGTKLEVRDGVEVRLQKGQIEIAEKILSSRGL